MEKTKLEKARMIFLIWGIIAAVVWVGLFIYFQPWGTKLGVPGSPQRMGIVMIIDFWLLKLPWTLFLVSIVAGKMKWLAPRGRFMEGIRYKLFTPYTYTAIAFMAAFFAVSGISNFQVFDLPSAPAAISSIYFSPIVAFCSVWIGGVLRALLFGQGEAVSYLVAFGLSDGFQYIILSVLYWTFTQSRWGSKGKSWGVRLVIRMVFWAIIYTLVATITLSSIYLWAMPAEMLLPNYAYQFIQYIPSGILAGLAGLLVAEVIIRAVESKKQTSGPVETK
jgi:hypothetical protein